MEGVYTINIPGLGNPNGIFVLADGALLVTTRQHTLRQIALSGRLATVAGYAEKEEDAEEDKDEEETQDGNMKGGFLDAERPRPLQRS